MSKIFEIAMENAMEKEFSWLDKFENPYSEYNFSQNFEYNMSKIIPKAEFTYVSVGNKRIPKTPAGYTITEQSKDDIFCDISYEDSKNDQIIFSACKSIETMGLSIDNEDADFKERTINGYKGYTYYKDGLSAIFWTDSAYFYTLQGTCDMSILLKMTESMDE